MQPGLHDIMTIGVPSVVALVGILVNITWLNVMSTRIQSLENRMDTRIDRFENKVDARFASLETKFDILTGKVVELDNRLTRVEEQLKHR